MAEFVSGNPVRDHALVTGVLAFIGWLCTKWLLAVTVSMMRPRGDEKDCLQVWKKAR